MSEVRTSELFFTTNNKFCYRNMYGLVKASCSGYNYPYFDLLDTKHVSLPQEVHCPFIKIRNKLKAFETLVTHGVTDDNLFFDLKEYSIVSDNMEIFVKLKISDTVIMSNEVKSNFESLDKAIEYSKHSLLAKWEKAHKDCVDEEFLADLAELIEIFNYAIEHGDFEVYEN